ncbi:MAG: nicotinate-nucleotide--dimethylbenzimidazole phosphoribosyltransferase, partial [Euryarchaeota archaeon]|nr:nicotinate-nucleotide--dimethylbenzimidazole phosphoribosyltransferase [Euryarchaeota archaeon]
MSLLSETVSRIGALSEEAMRQAEERQARLTKPPGSLGMLEWLSIRLAGIQGRFPPEAERKVIFTLAADHGVAEEGVSAFPREVTRQMVLNFLRGGAAINVLARHAGAEVVVVDIGVDGELEHPELVSRKISHGTRNIAREPAMSREQAVSAIEAGIEVASEVIRERDAHIIGVGDMGIANTTPSAAVCAAITGRAPEEVTGRGTGIDEEAWRRKVEVVRRAIEVNAPSPEDPLDVLAKLGGYEIAGIAGVILAGAANRVPVLIDGFISTAGALVAAGIAPAA